MNEVLASAENALHNAQVDQFTKYRHSKPGKIIQMVWHPLWSKMLYLDDQGVVWYRESKTDHNVWAKANDD